MIKICTTCYREQEEKEMTNGTLCNTCKGMIGKGAGYGNYYSEKEMEEWFAGTMERKRKLEAEGKLAN